MGGPFQGVEPGDPGEAAWLLGRLHPFGQDVGSVVPAGFAAYAGVVHPEGSLSQAQVEALLPLLPTRAGRQSPCCFCLWEGYGFLTPGARWQLSPSPATARRRSAGWMGTRLRIGPRSQPSQILPDWPRVHLPQREYLIARGPLEAVLAAPWLAGEAVFQSPNLWWPEDRKWCVASEIELGWTYVGGSAELIQAVLDSADLEAFPVRITD